MSSTPDLDYPESLSSFDDIGAVTSIDLGPEHSIDVAPENSIDIAPVTSIDLAPENSIDFDPETSSEPFEVPCNPQWTMAALERIISPSAEPALPRKLKGSSNFDEWKFDFEQWMYFQDYCVTHFKDGLLLYSKIDDSVKSYYELFTEDEIKRLVPLINSVLVHVIQTSVDAKKIRKRWHPTYPFHEMVKEVYEFGERDPIGREIAQLKSYYKTFNSVEHMMRYENIYPDTPKKIQVLNVTINPFQHNIKELKNLVKALESSDFEEKYAAASNITEPLKFVKCDQLLLDFQELVLDEIDVKPGDKIVRAKKKKKSKRRKYHRSGKS